MHGVCSKEKQQWWHRREVASLVQPPVDKIDLPDFESLFPSLREMTQSFSLEGYSSVGGAHTVIERQIKVDRKPRRCIEEIREMASPTSIQKKT